MVSSVVNGYFCASSCDVAKAKKGEDPHPSTGVTNADPTKVDGRNKTNAPGASDESALPPEQPAVIFSGALSALLKIDRVNTANKSQIAEAANRNRGFALDVLA